MDVLTTARPTTMHAAVPTVKAHIAPPCKQHTGRQVLHRLAKITKPIKIVENACKALPHNRKLSTKTVYKPVEKPFIT